MLFVNFPEPPALIKRRNIWSIDPWFGNPVYRVPVNRHGRCIFHHEDFLDFVSRRSPVFKRRTLPKSKREAIALMTDNPKLIRRPVLVVGYRVTFGFDKERYTDLVKSSH